jgi:HAD superfamily hydrolase (TIGR01549 family)
MINPDDVNLIIFDMDGTIVPSLPAVYESIKRAFRKLGWAVDFSEADINKFFGMPATTGGGALYDFITPADSHLTTAEVREKVIEEYPETFPEIMRPDPEVGKTLETLRRRGYKLVQYSNSSVSYLDMVMSTLDARKYYDYVECVWENGLTKIELVRKIREKFGGATAAVVGDRWHDLEAARETVRCPWGCSSGTVATSRKRRTLPSIASVSCWISSTGGGRFSTDTERNRKEKRRPALRPGRQRHRRRREN